MSRLSDYRAARRLRKAEPVQVHHDDGVMTTRDELMRYTRIFTPTGAGDYSMRTVFDDGRPDQLVANGVHLMTPEQQANNDEIVAAERAARRRGRSVVAGYGRGPAQDISADQLLADVQEFRRRNR